MNYKCEKFYYRGRSELRESESLWYILIKAAPGQKLLETIHNHSCNLENKKGN